MKNRKFIRQNHIWIVEWYDEKNNKWDATVGAFLSRREAFEGKRNEWEYNNPNGRFRVRKYIAIQPPPIREGEGKGHLNLMDKYESYLDYECEDCEQCFTIHDDTIAICQLTGNQAVTTCTNFKLDNQPSLPRQGRRGNDCYCIS